jgi:hypothetical protein
MFAIIFQRPVNERRGWSLDSDKNDWWINIECIRLKDEETDPEKILNFLNQYWSSDKKLMKLQSQGTVWKLGSSLKECITDLSYFSKIHNGKFKTFVSDSPLTLGDINYVNDPNDARSDLLTVPLCMSKSIESSLIDAKEYDWEYVFIFDRETKSFTYKKIELS